MYSMAFYNYAKALKAGEIDIKSARLKAGMTQKELANIIGVTKQTIINYEKGATEPDWERLEEIALALKISVDELFPYTELGDKKGDTIWAEHIVQLTNNPMYSRLNEEEIFLESLFNLAEFKKFIQKNEIDEEDLEEILGGKLDIPFDEQITLATLKLEHDIHSNMEHLLKEYQKYDDSIETIRFERNNKI